MRIDYVGFDVDLEDIVADADEGLVQIVSLDHFNILWCVNFDTYKVAVEKNHPKCAKYVSENLGVVTFDGGMKITPLCEVLLCNN